MNSRFQASSPWLVSNSDPDQASAEPEAGRRRASNAAADTSAASSPSHSSSTAASAAENHKHSISPPPLALERIMGGNGRTKWEEAAIYIKEGLDTEDKFIYHPKDKFPELAYHILHHPAFCVTHLVVSVLQMLLALVEEPAVIRFQDDGKQNILTTVHGIVEVLLLIFFSLYCFLRLVWFHPRNFFKHKRLVVICVVLVLMYVEVIAVIVRQNSHVRVLRSLRPLFLVDTHLMHSVRRVLQQILQYMKPIPDVLLPLLFIILLFSLGAFYLFADVDKDFFGTLGKSFVSLFVALTTANHPTVIMEAYHKWQWSAIFFITYLIVTLYILLNVLLGVVYANFKELETKQFKKIFLHKREALRRAYNTLDNMEGIKLEDFLKLMDEYSPQTPQWEVLCIFNALKTDGGGFVHSYVSLEECSDESALSFQEFSGFYNVISLRWYKTVNGRNISGGILDFFVCKNMCPDFDSCSDTMQKLVTIPSPLIRAQKAIHSLVKWRWFNSVMSTVVLINFIFVVVIALLDDVHQSRVATVSMSVSFVFLAVYCVEIFLRIVGLGAVEYFRSFWNIFDFAIIAASFTGQFLELDPSLTYAALLRPFRLLSNESLFFVGEYYSGSANSTTVHVFWLNNFNNILRSYVTLFEVMVVNNWYVMMEGFASEFSSRDGVLVRLFFMIFYITTLLTTAVIVSYLVEAFTFHLALSSQKSKKHQRHQQQQDGLTGDEEQAIQNGSDNYRERVSIVIKDSDFFYPSQELEAARNMQQGGRRLSVSLALKNMRQNSFEAHFIPIGSSNVAYHGSRLMTKEDLYLLMYEDQIPRWMEEADGLLHGSDFTDFPAPGNSTNANTTITSTTGGTRKKTVKEKALKVMEHIFE